MVGRARVAIEAKIIDGGVCRRISFTIRLREGMDWCTMLVGNRGVRLMLRGRREGVVVVIGVISVDNSNRASLSGTTLGRTILRLITRIGSRTKARVRKILPTATPKAKAKAGMRIPKDLSRGR